MERIVQVMEETWLREWDGLLWAEPWEKLSKVLEEEWVKGKGWGSIRIRICALERIIQVMEETWLREWDGLLWAEPWETLSKVMEEKVGQK